MSSRGCLLSEAIEEWPSVRIVLFSTGIGFTLMGFVNESYLSIADHRVFYKIELLH